MMECLNWLPGRLRDFVRRRTEGNVTVLLCLGLFTVVGAAGVAIDYIRLTREETLFAAAADAAALAAVSSAQTAELSKSGSPAATGTQAGMRAWEVNVSRSAITAGRTPKITLSKDKNGWSAVVAFDATAPTSFMSVMGIKTMRIAGIAKAAGGGKPVASEYWDVHLVVDNSSSMGIGATNDDMKAMRVKFGCEFACHSTQQVVNPETMGVSWTATPEGAHAAGAKLRIDIVDDAVDALMTEMKSWGQGAVRAELWGLNNSVESLVDLTTRLDDIKDHDIGIAPEMFSIGQTNYQAALSRLEGEVGASGSGSSEIDRRKLVFIVTDGVHDSQVATSNHVKTWNGDHYIGPIDPAFCQGLKARGALVGVLYIDYITPAGYSYLTNSFIKDVQPNLKACASDGLFYNANSPSAITKALSDMFNKAVKSKAATGTVRLVN